MLVIHVAQHIFAPIKASCFFFFFDGDKHLTLSYLSVGVYTHTHLLLTFLCGASAYLTFAFFREMLCCTYLHVAQRVAFSIF